MLVSENTHRNKLVNNKNIIIDIYPVNDEKKVFSSLIKILLTTLYTLVTDLKKFSRFFFFIPMDNILLSLATAISNNASRMSWPDPTSSM